jgi:hypothetical protein
LCHGDRWYVFIKSPDEYRYDAAHYECGAEYPFQGLLEAFYSASVSRLFKFIFFIRRSFGALERKYRLSFSAASNPASLSNLAIGIHFHRKMGIEMGSLDFGHFYSLKHWRHCLELIALFPE